MTPMLKLAAAAGALVLSGCVSVIPSPGSPDALFSVDAVSVGQPLAANLAVREPESPLIVSGQAMTSKSPAGEIRLLPGAEWAERSTRMLQLAVIDSFAVEADGAAVLPESGIRVDYEMTSRLQALELRGNVAVCDLTVALVDLRSREILAREGIRAEQTADSDKTLARATALKTAAESCAADMARFASSAVSGAEAP